MGHTIIMGRRTWESIGRPLPGRRTIVVTRQPDYSVADGVQIAASLDDALHIAEAAGESEAFIVGGAELYREALPQADRLYLTEVAADVEGDTYFPVNFEHSTGIRGNAGIRSSRKPTQKTTTPLSS